MRISCVGDLRRAELRVSEYHRAHHSTKGWDRAQQWGLRAADISCWMLTGELKVFSSSPVTTVPLPIIGAALDLLVDACRTHRWVTCDFGVACWCQGESCLQKAYRIILHQQRSMEFIFISVK